MMMFLIDVYIAIRDYLDWRLVTFMLEAWGIILMMGIDSCEGEGSLLIPTFLLSFIGSEYSVVSLVHFNGHAQ